MYSVKSRTVHVIPSQLLISTGYSLLWYPETHAVTLLTCAFLDGREALRHQSCSCDNMYDWTSWVYGDSQTVVSKEISDLCHLLLISSCLNLYKHILQAFLLYFSLLKSLALTLGGSHFCSESFWSFLIHHELILFCCSMYQAANVAGI